MQTGLGMIYLVSKEYCGGQDGEGCIIFQVFPNRDGRSIPYERTYWGMVPDAFSAGEWHQAVLTANGSNEVKAYIDGEFAIDIPLTWSGTDSNANYNFANLGARYATYFNLFSVHQTISMAQ